MKRTTTGIDPRNPRINDIPSFTPEPSWRVDVPLSRLAEFVSKAVNDDGLDLNPDFQRGHVWTEAQQIAFMEFVFRRGRTGRELFFNSPGWPRSGAPGTYVIVDGKQRLTAALRFMRGEIPIFGYRLHEFTDVDRMRMHLSFGWNINALATRAEVLHWYLEFNSGGTPHTSEELDRVRALLAKEVK